LFYAHAEANWDEPRESYIEFSANSPGHQDRLSYQDVDSLDWRKAALVILAGCETSGNRIYLGAGLTGLQRAFLAAGASQVLATYWKVDAMQVADQIPRFLEAWRQHHDALRALQAMQKMAIKELRNDPFFKYPHPQLWGAYNLTGAKVSVGEAMSLVAN
jgi:CHAT domain-containing protein